MTDPKLRVLFSEAQIKSFGRCSGCGWHPPTQGHHPKCSQSAESK